MYNKALKKLIEDFGTAIEQGHGAVYRRIFDEASYDYMGHYIEEITGYTSEELTPDLWDHLILQTQHDGELAGLTLDEANHKLRSGEVERWQADVQIRTQSGAIRWVSDMSTILRDGSGACIGCLGVLLDITERKEAEAKMALLTERLRHKNRQMDEELALAREVQQSLVSEQPMHFPPDVPFDQGLLQFCSRYLPAAHLAGDYFDITPLSEHKVGIFICDVMGHGVRAALLTTFLRGLMEGLYLYADQPGPFLRKMNEDVWAVFSHRDSLLFASAFYMVIDTQNNVVTYSNAGHPSPLVLKPESGQVVFLQPEEQRSEPALGMVEEFSYTTSEYFLTGMESLFLYTDGLVESCNKQDEMYGAARTIDRLRKDLTSDSETRMDHLMKDVCQFMGTDTFEDDVCLLAVVPASRR